MKTKKLITVAAVSAGLAFGVTAQATEEKHEEQTINSSDVPAAVQQAAQTEAKGGTIAFASGGVVAGVGDPGHR